MEGTHVYLWMIDTDGWQKPSQYCKVIILQLKKLKKKKTLPGLLATISGFLAFTQDLCTSFQLLGICPPPNTGPSAHTSVMSSERPDQVRALLSPSCTHTHTHTHTHTPYSSPYGALQSITSFVRSFDD